MLPYSIDIRPRMKYRHPIRYLLFLNCFANFGCCVPYCIQYHVLSDERDAYVGQQRDVNAIYVFLSQDLSSVRFWFYLMTSMIQP
jgi:hypothetical protein